MDLDCVSSQASPLTVNSSSAILADAELTLLSAVTALIGVERSTGRGL